MKDNDNDNFMDFVPVRSEKFRWEQDDEGRVKIYVEHNGMFDKVAQALFGKPKVTTVDLQPIGDYIWTKLDGTLTVYELGQKVSAKYGDEAEPLYPRIVQYLKMLEKYGFITIRKA